MSTHTISTFGPIRPRNRFDGSIDGDGHFMRGTSFGAQPRMARESTILRGFRYDTHERAHRDDGGNANRVRRQCQKVAIEAARPASLSERVPVRPPDGMSSLPTINCII